jgi:hypothetical protein
MPTIMGVNYPGTYEIEFEYVSDATTHKLRLNCELTSDPTLGDDFSTWSFATKGGGSVQGDTGIDAFLAVFRPLKHSDVDVINATLWKYQVGTFAKDFKGVYDINLAGTSGLDARRAFENIFTFRSTNGGIMKIHDLDCGEFDYLQRPYASGTTAQKNFVDYVLGSTAWMIARDDGYAYSFLKVSNGLNNALERRYYRV